MAMINLGVLYENGHGVAQDYAKAREWYQKAVDIGDATALANLEQLPIEEAVAAGRYAEALKLQAARAAKQEAAETKRERQARQGDGAGAYRSGVVRASSHREFTKALTAAERAHTLRSARPHDRNQSGARAHVPGTTEKKPRRSTSPHKGERISKEDGRPWERAIADDFADLRKAGLSAADDGRHREEAGSLPLIETEGKRRPVAAEQGQWRRR